MSLCLESSVGGACPLTVSLYDPNGTTTMGGECGGLTVVSFSVSSPNPVRDEVTGWKFFTDESLTLITSALHYMSRK